MTMLPIVHFEAASTLAVVVASNEPLLFLSADLKVIAVSASFCRAFGIDPATAPGKHLGELGNGEWAMPRLASLLNATALGQAAIAAYEIDLKRPDQPPRRLVINARTLDDGENDQVRLLMAVTDVTDARAAARHKDDLLHEKDILTQEIQHRVANSLQIIASILMQSARRVQSDEARGYLQNAHHRVMSIAAVQKQLSVIEGNCTVALRPYLGQLCESLAASMIADTKRVAIRVTVDDSVVDADTSVSLGLIVTELIINALKHAFPDQQQGIVAVDYRSVGDGWTLSVSDDGVGIATGLDAPKAGLGTGIVEALSRNLESEIEVTDSNPGTAVRVRHQAGTATQTEMSLGRNGPAAA